MSTDKAMVTDALTRPIIGIENRTAQEAFDIMCDRIRRSAALAQAEQTVAAKPLEWIAPWPDEATDTRRSAVSLGLAYFVDEVDDHWEATLYYWGCGASISLGIYGTLDDVKAAAQSDYERRIRSALSAALSEAEQQPVAVKPLGEVIAYRGPLSTLSNGRDLKLNVPIGHIPIGTKLYAHPPAQREAGEAAAPVQDVDGLTPEGYVADFIAHGEKSTRKLPPWEQAYQDAGLIDEAANRGYIWIGRDVACTVEVTPHGRTAAELHRLRQAMSTPSPQTREDGL